MRVRRLLIALALACGGTLPACGWDTPVSPPDAGRDAAVRPDADEEEGWDAEFPPLPGPDAGPDAGPRGPDAEVAGPDASEPSSPVDLRADTNRNGTIELADPSEDADEQVWNAQHGAVFLANLDDDQGTCAKSGSDVALAACHDGADEVTNGPDDLLDLARLKTVPWPDAPADAVGTLAIAGKAASYVRLFRAQGSGFTVFRPASDTLSSTELRAGVELAIEGKDLVRDTAAWDGFADVTLTVSATALPAPLSDTVRMRVAPLILRHHLDPPETIYVSSIQDPGSTALQGDLSAGMSAAQIANPLVRLSTGGDQWTQDLFETGYMSMPAVGGMKVIRVNVRSANVENPRSSTSPLRPGGRVVFTSMRGKDVAGIAQYDVNHDEDMDTLDSFGNTETIPPYSHNGQSYPLGRLYRGSVPSYHPDPKMAKLLESQAVQPPVYVDTSWLLVGHVDETVTFVKANTPRGWAVVVNDAALAKSMLQQQVAAGNGGVKMFVGQNWVDDWGSEYSAAETINSVLADTNVMAASAEAVIEVNKQLDIIKRETGITDAEILRLPFLHWSQYDYSVAYQVGTVNGISLGDAHYGMPEPHGPVINGRDIMKVQAEAEMAKVGITVHWIEDWDLYHRLMGEVHCGSNTARKIPANVRWWESGR